MRSKGARGMSFLTSIAIALLCFSIFSCSLEYKEGKNAGLTIKLADYFTATDSAYTSPAYYKVQIIGTDGIIMRTAYTDNPSAILSFPDLAAGNYSVKIYGYDSSDMQTILGYSDSSLVIDNDDNSGSAEVGVTAESTLDGKVLTGNIEVTMSWNSNIDIDQVRVVNADGDEIALCSTDTATENENGSMELTVVASVPTGIAQNLSFEYLSDGIVLGRSSADTFTVYSGQKAYSIRNNHSEDDPYQDILTPESPMINLAYTDSGVMLTWNNAQYVDKYEVYRTSDGTTALIGETTEFTFVDKGPLPTTEYTYIVKAINTKTALYAYSNTVIASAFHNPEITITLPEGPESVHVAMQNISGSTTLLEGGSLSFKVDEVEGIVSYEWLLNTYSIGKEPTVVINSDNRYLNTSEIPAIQHLTLVLTNSKGQAYSGTADFIYEEN